MVGCCATSAAPCFFVFARNLDNLMRVKYFFIVGWVEFFSEIKINTGPDICNWVNFMQKLNHIIFLKFKAHYFKLVFS